MRDLAHFELAMPVNFQLACGVEGSVDFELGPAEHEMTYLEEGDCVTVWSVSVMGIDTDSLICEVMDWTNQCGRFSSDEAWCEAAVWVAICGNNGVRKVIELCEFSMREHCLIVRELRASIAHNAT